MDYNYDNGPQNGFHSEAGNLNPLYATQIAPETTPMGDLLKLRQLRDDIVAGKHPQFTRAESNPDFGFQKHEVAEVRAKSVEGRIMGDGSIASGSRTATSTGPAPLAVESVPKLEPVDPITAIPLPPSQSATTSSFEPLKSTLVASTIGINMEIDITPQDLAANPRFASLVKEEVRLEPIKAINVPEKRATDESNGRDDLKRSRSNIVAADLDRDGDSEMGGASGSQAAKGTRSSKRITPKKEKEDAEKLEFERKKKEKKKKKEKEKEKKEKKKEKKDEKPLVEITIVPTKAPLHVPPPPPIPALIPIKSKTIPFPALPSILKPTTSNVSPAPVPEQASGPLLSINQPIRMPLPAPPPLTDLIDRSLDSRIEEGERISPARDRVDSKDESRESREGRDGKDDAFRRRIGSRDVVIIPNSPPQPRKIAPYSPPRKSTTHGDRWAPRSTTETQTGTSKNPLFKNHSSSAIPSGSNLERRMDAPHPPSGNRDAPGRPTSIPTFPSTRKADPRAAASRWAPTVKEVSPPARMEPPRASLFAEGLDARSFLREYDSLVIPNPVKEDPTRASRYADDDPDSHNDRSRVPGSLGSRIGGPSDRPYAATPIPEYRGGERGSDRGSDRSSSNSARQLPLSNRISDRDEYAPARGEGSSSRRSPPPDRRPLASSLPPPFASGSNSTLPILNKSTSRPDLKDERNGRSDPTRPKVIAPLAGRDFPPPPGMDSYETPPARSKRPYVAPPLSVTAQNTGKKVDTRFNYTAAQRPDIRPAHERPGYVAAPAPPLSPSFDRFDDRGPPPSSASRYDERPRGYVLPREESRSREDFRSLPPPSASSDYRNTPRDIARDPRDAPRDSRDGLRDSRDGPRDLPPRDDRDGPSRDSRDGPRDRYYQDGPAPIDRRMDSFDDRDRRGPPLSLDNYPRREYATDERMDDRRTSFPTFADRPAFDDGYRRDDRREVDPRGPPHYDDRRPEERRLEERRPEERRPEERRNDDRRSSFAPAFHDRPLYDDRPIYDDRAPAYDSRNERRGEFDRGYDRRDGPPPAFDDRRDGPPGSDHRPPARYDEPPSRQFDEPKSRQYEEDLRGPPRRMEPAFNYVDSRPGAAYSSADRGGYADSRDSRYR